ncbi:hypothetical protein, partial [Chitinibacter sp. ZOR0017]|uniref:hypothetical protein n=1 Tax=Chitinibacter sp. ZOR0017 TaxID=1339254 RepID=UPI001E44CFD6
MKHHFSYLVVIVFALTSCKQESQKIPQPTERPRLAPSVCRKKPPTPEQIEEVRKQLIFEACASGNLYRIPRISYAGGGVGDNIRIYLA